MRGEETLPPVMNVTGGSLPSGRSENCSWNSRAYRSEANDWADASDLRAVFTLIIPLNKK